MTLNKHILALATALLASAAAGALHAQQPAAPPAAPAAGQPYFVGNPLGLPINPAPDGKFTPISPNVKVYGAIYSAESCSYDPVRGVIVVPNRGVAQNLQTNNAWISFINHDGSVHTARWVGIQTPGPQRANSTPPLVLNEPFGSDIVNGTLYLADRDGGTSPDRSVGLGRPPLQHADRRAGRRVRVEKSTGFNDIAVAKDGNIYATVTGSGDGALVWKITPDGTASIFAQSVAAGPTQRRRARSPGQHRRRQHRQRERDDVLAGWQGAEDRERGAERQRRSGDYG